MWTPEARLKWKEKNPKHHIEYYAKNRKKRLANSKRWQLKHPETAKERSHEWYERTKDSRREFNTRRNREKWRELKNKIFDKYGGKCVKCGIDDFRVLQIDHVNGGGRQEFKQYTTGYYQYYKRVLSDDTGKYQLLCANCNWIKRWEEVEV